MKRHAAAEQKYPVIDAYRQRMIDALKQLRQRLESFYQDLLAGNQ